MKASCTCGQLRIHVEGPITRSSICHCFACQSRTGSVFGVQSRVEKKRVTIDGRSTAFTRTGDDPADGTVTFHFCPICGSTVYWSLQGMDDHVVVAAGAFQDPAFPAPTFSVYEDRMHPWVRLPDSITEHWN